MENLEEKISKNLEDLKQILEIDNPINIPFEQKDKFLYDMNEIVMSGLNEKVYNYSTQVLHLIYKKRIGKHELWLDEFELSVKSVLKY